jgi:hypothetical protein
VTSDKKIRLMVFGFAATAALAVVVVRNLPSAYRPSATNTSRQATEFVSHPWFSNASADRLQRLAAQASASEPAFFVFDRHANFFKADIVPVHFSDRDDRRSVKEMTESKLKAEAAQHGFGEYAYIMLDPMHTRLYTPVEILALISVEVDYIYNHKR